jgi:hypothetical protein
MMRERERVCKREMMRERERGNQRDMEWESEKWRKVDIVALDFEEKRSKRHRKEIDRKIEMIYTKGMLKIEKR